MSQLDISIFYSHLLTLLLILYMFFHFSIIILSNYYYNEKIRLTEDDFVNAKLKGDENSIILAKIFT